MLARKWVCKLFKQLFGFEDRFNKAQRLREYYRLRPEALEERVTPSTTRYVDNPAAGNVIVGGVSGDFAVTNDQGAIGVLDAGDTVTWDPGAGSAHGAAVTGLTFGTNAFGTIQSAVNASASGDTVRVAAGNFNELVTIPTSISILGNNTDFHPVVGANTADVVTPRVAETFLTHNGLFAFQPQAANITIDGFTFAGTSGSRTIDVSSGSAPNLTISNNIFANTGTAGSAGVIQLTGGGDFSNLNIEFNLFEHRGVSASNAGYSLYTGLGNFTGMRIANNKFNVEDVSVFEGGSTPYVNAVVANNEFDGTIAGVAGAGYGLLNMGQAGNISIRENLFHNMQYTAFQVGIVGGEVVRNTFDQMYSDQNGFADAFQLWGGQFGTAISSNVNIANNIIHFNDDATNATRGIRLRAPAAGLGIDGTTIHVNENTFIDGHAIVPSGAGYAILDQGDPTKAVDASGNWWGTTIGATPTATTPFLSQIAALMSGPVHVGSFLNSGGNGATIGFAPAAATEMWVPQTAATTGNLVVDGKIQDGINSAIPGMTVRVAADTYKENVNVNKAVTLVGANAGALGSGSRGGESRVVSNGNAVFTISASNVTIDGFSMDGDDPTVTGVPLASGDDTNVLYGVRANGTFSGLTIENNIIQHVFIGFRGDGAASNNVITRNWFNSIGNFDFGYAISLRGNFYADITNNLMTKVWTGVHLNNFNGAGGPATWTMSGNEIHDYAGGLLYWLQYNGATGLTVDNNQFFAETGAVANNFGIMMVSIQDAVNPSFTNNTITGADYGIGLTNVATSNIITLGATNSIVDSKLAGVYLTDNLTFNPVGTTDLTSNASPQAIAVNLTGLSITGAAGVGVKVETSRVTPNVDVATTVTISGATISGNAGTIGVDVEGALAKADLSNVALSGFATGIRDNGGILSVGTGNTIAGGATGLAINGATASVTGDTLGNLAFTGQSGQYIVLSSGALLGHKLNATGVSFGGLIGSVISLEQNFGLEDRITHAVDDGTLGFVRVKAANVFVTPTSGSIQRGINAASAADTVNVAAGTFTENIVLNKQVTLLGAQGGVDARGRGAPETIVTPANPAIRTLELVTGAAGAVINGFTFSGGVREIESTSGPLNNLQILNNRILAFTDSGIFLNDSGSDITIDKNVVDGASKTTPGDLVHLDTDTFNGFYLTNNNLVNGATATGFFVDGNHNVAPSLTRTPLISGNLISGNATGMNLGSRSFGSATVPNAGTISNNTFASNLFDGLQAGIQNVLVTQNTFTGNARWGLNLTSFGNAAADRGAQNSMITQNLFSSNGVPASPNTTGDVVLSAAQAPGTISTNVLFNNSFGSGTALVYNGTETINASGNWWGNATGPTLATHPSGTGNRINGTGASHIDFTPWLNVGTEDPSTGANAGFQGDFSNLNVDDDSPQSGSTTRINEAIALLADGSLTGGARTVHVLAGSYAENVIVNKALTLAGAGSGNTATDTILDAGGAVGIDLQAGSVTLQDLRVQNGTNGVYTNFAIANVTLNNVASVSNSNAGFEVHNSANVQNLTLTNANLSNNSIGFRTATTGVVNGLNITNGHFDSNTSAGLYTNANSASTTNQNSFTNITIDGTTFSNNGNKGIYAEVLDHAIVKNIQVINSGTSGAGAAGIDINLKFGTYSNLSFVNDTITNSGTGAATGAGLTIKARGDSQDSPTYQANPAHLSALTLTNVSVSGSPVDLALGDNIVLNTVAMTDVALGGTGRGLVIYENSDASPGQTLNIANTSFAGTLATYIEEGSPGTTINATGASFNGTSAASLTVAAAYGVVDKILDAVDVGTTVAGVVRIQSGQTFVTPNSFLSPTTATPSIQRAIDASLSGDTIHVQSGTYTGSVSSPGKAVTFSIGASPGQVTLNGDFTLDSSDTFVQDIANYVAGTGFDQLFVNGVVTLGGATLVVNDTLADPVTLGTSFKIIDNDSTDPVIGSFTIAGATVGPDGVTRFVRNGHAYEVYTDFGTAPHNGNDVVLRLDQNDAPVNTVPPMQVIAESTALVFSTANGNAISISDSDAGTADVQMTLRVTHGTLTLAGIAGLSFTFSDANGTGQGDGTANSTMTFRGSIASINAALNGLTYTPATNFSASDTLEITTNDLGHTGPPGPLSTFGAVTIVVVNTDNDAPVAPNRSFTILEDTSVTGLLTASDPESDPVTFAPVIGPLHGTLSIDSATGAFTYTPNANYNGPDSFTYQANDGVNNSLPGTVNISITAVNDAPLASNGSASTNEDTAVTIDLNPLVSDIETSNANLVFNVGSVSHGTLTPVAGQNGKFLYTPTGNYNGPDSFTFSVTDTGDPVPAPGNVLTSPTRTLSITVVSVNDAPVAVADSYTVAEDTPLSKLAVNGVLANDTDPLDTPANVLSATLITSTSHGTLAFNTDGSFLYTPNANYNGPDSFTYQVKDDGGGANNGNIVTVSINVTPVNDAPLASNGSASTNEDTAVTIDLNPLVSDIETSNANLVFNVGSVSHGTLTPVAGQNGKFLYTPTGNYNGPDSFTFSVTDTGDPVPTPGNVLTSATRTLSITVVSVNDAPVAVADSYTVAEDATLSKLAVVGVLANDTDPSDTPANVLSATLITSTSHGTLAFNTDGSFTYTPNANYNGPDSFTYQVKDDGGTANGGINAGNIVTVSINVTSVNDAPAGTDNTVTTNEDTPYVFHVADFGFTDPLDTPNNLFNRVKITTVPTTGSLTLGGLPVAAGDFVTVAQLNANQLVFTPAANANGVNNASFTFQVEDDGGGANLDLSPNTITVNVSSVNDAPAGTDNTVTTNESTPYVFHAADFGFTDPLDSPANLLNRVMITTTPTAGSLTLGGVPVAAGDFVTVAQLNANQLVFTPATNANGLNYASFTFQVEDDGGGANLDLSANTLTINVSAVNNPPVNTVPGSQTATVNTTLVFAGANALSVADVDAAAGLVQVTLSVSHGTLTLGSTAGLSFVFSDANGAGQGTGAANAAMTFRGTLASVNAALNGLTYQPAVNYMGPDSLSITTNDLGNTGSGGALSDVDLVNIAVLATFQDNFNRANNATLGANWTSPNGAFLVASQMAFASQGINFSTVNGLSLGDAVVQADVALGAVGDQYAGVVARYAGPGVANMYWGGLYRVSGTTYAAIYRNIGGTWDLLSFQMVAGNGNGTVRFEVVNDSLKLFVNGTLATSAFDSAITAPGSTGLYSSQGNFMDNFSASPHAALTNVTLPYPTETFTQPNGTQLDTAWRERAGSFSFLNNQLASSGATNLATLNGVSQADVVVQADVALAAAGDPYAGVVARYSGPGVANMYWGGLHRQGGVTSAEIYRNIGGTWILLSSQANVPSNATVRFEVIGDSLQLYVNGTLATDAFDSMITAAGSVGLYDSPGNNFDNFSAVVHPPLPTSFTDSFTQAGSSLSTSWRNRDGSYIVQGNQASSVAATNLATVNSIVSTDAVVQADVTLNLTGDQYAGVVARYTGSTTAAGSPVANMYWGGLFRIGGTTFAQIYSNINGTWTRLSSQAVATSSATIRFEVSGSSLKLFVNGVLQTSAIDTALTAAGSVGMFSSQGNILDTFSATA